MGVELSRSRLHSGPSPRRHFTARDLLGGRRPPLSLRRWMEEAEAGRPASTILDLQHRGRRRRPAMATSTRMATAASSASTPRCSPSGPAARGQAPQEFGPNRGIWARTPPTSPARRTSCNKGFLEDWTSWSPAPQPGGGRTLGATARCCVPVLGRLPALRRTGSRPTSARRAHRSRRSGGRS